MKQFARVSCLLVVAALSSAPALPSQLIAAQSPAGGCSSGRRVAKSLFGATVGAFVGLVGAKIRYSDWSDESRTSAGIRAQNRAMGFGAVVGASLGNFVFGSLNCSSRGASRAPVDARRVITAADIQKFGGNGSVYDLVFALRKQWLNTRGVELSETPGVSMSESGGAVTSAAPTLIAYLDNARLGDMEQLRTMPLTGVVAVRYYDAAQATQRFGAGHRHGVIQVITVAEQAEATGPISVEEARQSGIQGTVYDLVLARRRSWLSGGEKAMPGEEAPLDPDLPVYVNEVRAGTLAALKTLPIAGVVGVRFYDGAEATFKWGLGHSHGAIQVLRLDH